MAVLGKTMEIFVGLKLVESMKAFFFFFLQMQYSEKGINMI